MNTRFSRGIVFLGALGLAGVLGLLRTPAVWAARQAQAVLWQVDLAQYPQAEAWVSVYGPDGFFVPDLTPDAFTVTEAGEPRPVESIAVEKPGLHIALALNPGRAFAVRDVQGVPRQLYIFYQLQTWLEHAPAGRHDLSLLTLQGPTLTHTDDPRAVLDALTDYYARQGQTFREMTPEITPLVHAITQAAAPSPRPGMGRVVLWITAPVPDLQPEDLELPRQRAQDAHVRLWIWLVGPAAEANTRQGQLWAQLAADTGGQFLVFSGQEVLPDLAQAFDALDGVYRVRYPTAQTEPGVYPVQVAVHSPYGPLRTQEALLDLNLSPPQVRWLEVPSEVTRRAATPGSAPSTWPPTEQRLEVAVTFPDGHNRPVRRSALWVDGEKVAEHTAPPFERFVWDLTRYQSDGTHRLQVVVEDALGLTGASPEVEVQVRVIGPTPAATAPRATATAPAAVGPAPTAATPQVTRPGLSPVVWGSALVAGMVLVAALWWAWQGKQRWSRGARGPARSPSPTPPSGWGVLEPLPPLEPDWPTPPRVMLQAPEVVLGSDPAQAQVVLNDRSVSPRHARLWRDPNGHVFIADLRSLAGTWVNYAPIRGEGTRVETGDVLHIGRLGFRLVLTAEEDTA